MPPAASPDGEAVGIGLVLAVETSARMSLCAQEEPGGVAAHLESMGMKHRLADIPGERQTRRA